jgi:hypothetical protein
MNTEVRWRAGENFQADLKESKVNTGFPVPVKEVILILLVF